MEFFLSIPAVKALSIIFFGDPFPPIIIQLSCCHVYWHLSLKSPAIARLRTNPVDLLVHVKSLKSLACRLVIIKIHIFSAKIKKKMLYSSSFDALKKCLVGVQKYIQVREAFKNDLHKTYRIFHFSRIIFSLVTPPHLTWNFFFNFKYFRGKNKNVLELPKNHFKDVKKKLQIFHMLFFADHFWKLP